MIVKVAGEDRNGRYKETTFDGVETYTVEAADQKDTEEHMYLGDSGQLMRIMLHFEKKESISIIFSSRVYIMNDLGKTIDILPQARQWRLP